MILKVKKTCPTAFLPTKGTKYSVGWDLYIPGNLDRKYHIWKNDVKKIDFGISVEIPEGYWGQIVIRSSLGKQGLTLANSVGVIDSDYRGSLCALVVNFGSLERILMPGDRIAQLIIHKVVDVEIEEVDELSITDRGDKGTGSTGK